MKARTIHFPDEVVEALEVLVEHGIFHNVSDAVRQIVTNFQLPLSGSQLFKNLSKYDKVFTLAHEALHLALLTAERRQGRDPLLWNIATDCIINFLLMNTNIRPSADFQKIIVTPETIFQFLHRIPQRKRV